MSEFTVTRTFIPSMQKNPRNPAQDIPPAFIALAVWLPLLRGSGFIAGLAGAAGVCSAVGELYAPMSQGARGDVVTA